MIWSQFFNWTTLMQASAPFVHRGWLVQQRRLSGSGCAPGSVNPSSQWSAAETHPHQVTHAHPLTPLSLAWAPEKTFSFFPEKNTYRGEAKQRPHQTLQNIPGGSVNAPSWSETGFVHRPFNMFLGTQHVSVICCFGGEWIMTSLPSGVTFQVWTKWEGAVGTAEMCAAPYAPRELPEPPRIRVSPQRNWSHPEAVLSMCGLGTPVPESARLSRDRPPSVQVAPSVSIAHSWELLLWVI